MSQHRHSSSFLHEALRRDFGFIACPTLGRCPVNREMDSEVPMILPKGIVVNTTNIYQEVASFPIVPAAKIWEYWHGMWHFLIQPKKATWAL